MSDITQAVEQDAIAESLLSDDNIVARLGGGLVHEGERPPAEEAEPDGSEAYLTDNEREIADTLVPDQEQEEQQAIDPRDEAGRRAMEEFEHDRLLDDIQRHTAEREAERQAEMQSPAKIQEGMQRLDADVEQHGLNDPVAAKAFADDFCGAFGSDPVTAGADVQALGKVMAKTALSGLKLYHETGGDASKAPFLPAESAKAFTREFLAAWGVDARTAEHVNERALAGTVLAGVMNFIDSYQRFGGRITDVSQLNEPAMAEQWANSLLTALGYQGGVDRAVALKLADAGGKYVLSMISKLQQMQPQQRGQGRQSRGNSARQTARRAARGPSRFQTNQDIFDEDTMDRWQREHGRL
jgi:hypothetical protein